MTDAAGNEVHEGAVLKVFHYVSRSRRRKEFMYKQVGPTRGKYREIWHLPITPLKSGGFYLKQEDEVLEDSVVVQCNCNFHIYNDLKRIKGFGS